MGPDTYAKIRAGASLVQLYTALVYHGPRLVEEIRRDLATLLRADGFADLRDAVGADHRQGFWHLFPRSRDDMTSLDIPQTLPVFGGISALASRYDGYILDLWGVLHNGVEPYPGVIDCLDR